MENHHYADSGDSSPLSREIDCDDDLPPPARVKLMCSYGGRIQPRPHDNQLAYVGGETKIVAVNRSIRFPAFLLRLSALLPAAPESVCFKYQLPGEELDALISITNDEDIEHMMLEYDRLIRSASKPAARLRLFLFLLNGTASIAPGTAVPDQKPDRQWFEDASNSISVSAPIFADSAPAPAPISPDFLFDLDKGFVKVTNPAAKEDKEDLQISGEEIVSPAEIQRQQIQDLQRLQILTGNDSLASRVLVGDQYMPRAPEKAQPAPEMVQIPAAYWPEKNLSPTDAGEQAVYLVPVAAPAMYSGSTTAAYFAAVPRVAAPETYRDAAAMYSVRAQQGTEGAGLQVAYDSTGRVVYYTNAVVPTYQMVTSVGPMNTVVDDSKVVKPPQVS